MYLEPHDQPVPFGNWNFKEPTSLILWTVAKSDLEAFEKVVRLLELIVDDLSFQLQEPMPIMQVEVLRFPVDCQVGDEVGAWILPYPDGYKQYKEALSVMWGTSIKTERFPSLRADYPELPPRVQNALDWYLKALGASSDADRFINFWIAFEISRDASSVRVEEPTKLRCGHTVNLCPHCNRPTDSYRQAASTKKFLESLGLPQEVRDRLWNMRQLVHGAKSFNEALLTELGGLVQHIQAASMACIKMALDIEGPLPAHAGVVPAARSGPTMLMKRRLASRDLRNTPAHLQLQVEAQTATGLQLYNVLSRLGIMLRNLGDLLGAERVFRRMITEAPTNDVIEVGKANLGTVLSRRRQDEAAEEMLRSVIDAGSKYAAAAANNLAVHLIERQKLGEALATLEPFTNSPEIEPATRYAESVGDSASSSDSEREIAVLAYHIALLTSESDRKRRISAALTTLEAAP